MKSRLSLSWSPGETEAWIQEGFTQAFAVENLRFSGGGGVFFSDGPAAHWPSRVGGEPDAVPMKWESEGAAGGTASRRKKRDQATPCGAPDLGTWILAAVGTAGPWVCGLPLIPQGELRVGREDYLKVLQGQDSWAGTAEQAEPR